MHGRVPLNVAVPMPHQQHWQQRSEHAGLLRRPPPWQEVVVGAVAAAALWLHHRPQAARTLLHCRLAATLNVVTATVDGMEAGMTARLTTSGVHGLHLAPPQLPRLTPRCHPRTDGTAMVTAIALTQAANVTATATAVATGTGMDTTAGAAEVAAAVGRPRRDRRHGSG